MSETPTTPAAPGDLRAGFRVPEARGASYQLALSLAGLVGVGVVVFGYFIVHRVMTGGWPNP